jgi:cobaltochelatase CobS
MPTIQELQTLAASGDPVVADIARQELEKIQAREKVSVDKDFADVVNEINDLIRTASQSTGGGAGGFNETEANKLITQRLKKFKVGVDQLSEGVKEQIGKTSSVQVVNFEGVAMTMKGGEQRRLFDVILSDVEANNNVYLYGGAGTGKTFISGLIAKALNYKLITLNCNQFTSPLDIVGGQTIEGYQEGRLTEAWGNLDMGINPRTCMPYSGAVLLLDEIPKLDPNTAGILNDALSKIKDPKEKVKDCATGEERIMEPIILNGRGQQIEKKNIFVIATGNSLLNEADKDYEANFKQDLSLQDRFAGSCYQIFIDYRYELNNIMRNIFVNRLNAVMDFTFIFNFLAQLRDVIGSNEFTGRAFVSTRLMISFRDTYIAQRINMVEANPIPRPKTLQIATESFLSLFTETQQSVITQAVDINEFYRIVNEKIALPSDEPATDAENAIAEQIIENYESKRKSEL